MLSATGGGILQWQATLGHDGSSSNWDDKADWTAGVPGSTSNVAVNKGDPEVTAAISIASLNDLAQVNFFNAGSSNISGAVANSGWLGLDADGGNGGSSSDNRRRPDQQRNVEYRQCRSQRGDDGHRREFHQLCRRDARDDRHHRRQQHRRYFAELRNLDHRRRRRLRRDGRPGRLDQSQRQRLRPRLAGIQERRDHDDRRRQRADAQRSGRLRRRRFQHLSQQRVDQPRDYCRQLELGGRREPLDQQRAEDFGQLFPRRQQ